MVAKRFHHRRELLQGQASDRKHVGVRLEAVVPVLLAKHVSEPLKHVRPDRPRPRRIVAVEKVAFRRDILLDRNCDEAACQSVRRGAARQGLEHNPHPRRRRLQDRGNEHAVLPEPDAVLPQGPSGVLVQRLDLVGDLRPPEHAHRLDQPVREATPEPGQLLVGAEGEQRAAGGKHCLLDIRGKPTLHLFAHIVSGLVGNQRGDLRREDVVPGRQFSDSIAVPSESAFRREVELGIRGLVHAGGAQAEFRPQRRAARLLQRLGFAGRLALVLPEAEALDAADMLAVHADFAPLVYVRQELLLAFESAHENAGPLVDEPARKHRVQSVRQAILHLPGPLAPMPEILDPVPALRDIGPSPHECDSPRQRVHVAVRLVDAADLGVEPVIGNEPVVLDEREHLLQQVRMLERRNLAEIRQLADVPQQPHVPAAGKPRAHFRRGRDLAKRQQVVGLAGPCEQGIAAGLADRIDQRLDRSEFQIRIPPLKLPHRGEPVLHDGGRHAGLQRRSVAGHAERPVLEEPARAARDLRQLVRGQPPEFPAVELGEAGKRHMGNVEIEAHPDRVRRDEEIDIAVLEHFDLGVPGSGTQGAHDDRRPSPLAPYQLRDRVNVFHRKADYRRAGLHPGDLLRPRVGKVRQPAPALEGRVGDQLRNHVPHGVGSEEQRLRPPAGVQQPVRENVPAVGVSAELDLVHGKEVHGARGRHRFDRAYPVDRLRRHDALLARHQSDHRRAAHRAHLVEHLPGEQPQRQPDHPGRMAEHPLDGVQGLARVGRAQDR